MADRTRVVVAGSGMSGLCAAVSAVEAGAEVIVLEKAPRAGGSAALSGGLIWTNPDEETIVRLIPHGDPELQSAVSRGLESALDWLSSQGVSLMGDVSMPHGGAGRAVEPPHLIAAVLKRLADLQVVVRTDSPMRQLLLGQAGEVRGVVAGSSRPETVEADPVILASGGFQGNPQLVRTHLGIAPENVQLRAKRWSSGDGLTEGVRFGAATTLGLSTFYGHALAAPPATFPPDRLREASQYYGQQAVAINLDGRRFVDETAGTGEECLNLALAHQRDGRGFYVVDGHVAQDKILLDMHIQTIIDRAVALDVPYVVADSLEDLCEGLAAHRAPPASALDALSTFQRTSGGGPWSEPRTSAVQEPPCPAAAAVPGRRCPGSHYLHDGRAAVDGRTRVLSRSASTSRMVGSMTGTHDGKSPGHSRALRSQLRSRRGELRGLHGWPRHGPGHRPDLRRRRCSSISPP